MNDDNFTINLEYSFPSFYNLTACDFESYLNLNNSITTDSEVSTIYDFFKYTSVNTTQEINFLNEIPGISLSDATKLI